MDFSVRVTSYISSLTPIYVKTCSFDAMLFYRYFFIQAYNKHLLKNKMKNIVNVLVSIKSQERYQSEDQWLVQFTHTVEIINIRIWQTCNIHIHNFVWFFQRDCPEGLLSKNKFLEVYTTFFPTGNPDKFCEHVFRSFDEDNSGKIDFKEFLLAINITSGGNPQDKLNWAFNMYDIDGNGTIEKKEMVEIIAVSILMYLSQWHIQGGAGVGIPLFYWKICHFHVFIGKKMVNNVIETPLFFRNSSRHPFFSKSGSAPASICLSVSITCNLFIQAVFCYMCTSINFDFINSQNLQ